jgi:TetR/AcrR family transcriptional regulator, transcriptional repressor for nem operon
MRKSKQETAHTRRRIVETAAAEFRRNGIAGTGLADVMSAAGLTHGGFYRHFASKEQLVAEACTAALDSTIDGLENAALGAPQGQRLRKIVSQYLSTAHRDEPGEGCAVAALGGEIARTDERTRAAVTDRLLKLIDLLQRDDDSPPAAESKRRALVAASTMVGALILSRIVTDRALSESILRHAKEHVLGSSTTPRES